MKSVNPKEDYTYTPEWAPEVTVHYVQPFGTTITSKEGFLDLYIDKFITKVDGLEIAEGCEGMPWSRLLPPRLSNEMFVKIQSLGKLEPEEVEG